MKITLLGTGTSHGIPCIACDCPVCTSSDPHDNRMRCSAFVENENADGTKTSILIDIGPEFRIQAIREHIKAIDAVLLTHSHSDHLHGLDDIRIFSHTISSGHITNPKMGLETKGPGIAIYSNAQSLRDVRYRFAYVFRETQLGGGKPKLRLVDERIFRKRQPQEFGDIHVTPIQMKHGKIDTTGWLLSVGQGENASGIHGVVNFSGVGGAVENASGVTAGVEVENGSDVTGGKEVADVNGVCGGNVVENLYGVRGEVENENYSGVTGEIEVANASGGRDEVGVVNFSGVTASVEVESASGVSGVRSFAYLTDCSYISDESIEKIVKNGGVIEHCVIDGLRETPHSTHFSFLQAMAVAEKIKPVHTWFTHICHLKKHTEISEYIKKHLQEFPNLSKIVKNGGSVEPAFDRQVIWV